MKHRATLTIARPAKPRTGPPLSLVKKALRLFKAPGIPKALYRKNVAKWLAAHLALGERHILRKGVAKWGIPGEPDVKQVYAPRRIGGSSC